MTIVILYVIMVADYAEQPQTSGKRLFGSRLEDVMARVSDKLLLFAFLFTAGVFFAPLQELILPSVISLALVLISDYFSGRPLSTAAYIIYCAAGFFYPPLMIFLPLLSYDIIDGARTLLLVPGTAVLLLSGYTQDYGAAAFLPYIAALAAAAMLGYRTRQVERLKSEYIRTRDNLTAASMKLESRVHKMAEQQEMEINIATLNERNRIAREIHDNVGHLLASSILQLGAVMAVTQEDQTKESLSVLKGTLTDGMNSIRSSVHNLRDDAVDLYSILDGMTRDFSFCRAVLNYELTSALPVSVRYVIIGIVKEALANVIKHSDADEVSISLYEHPSIYQLIIKDNGHTLPTASDLSGMGLENIRQRGMSLGGVVNITSDNGFRIFISFPRTEENTTQRTD